jgi:hypothetical protein
MAMCRECKQTYKHKGSCSRSKSAGRVYVDTEDTLLSSWPAGAFDSGVSSYSDTGSTSSYGDSGSSSSSSGSCGE